MDIVVVVLREQWLPLRRRSAGRLICACGIGPRRLVVVVDDVVVDIVVVVVAAVAPALTCVGCC